MEPMEEVPLKELGETEWGASRGIAYLMTQIAYSESQGGELRMLLVNRVQKTNSFRECDLKTALTRSTYFCPKCTKYRLAAGLHPDTLGSLQLTLSQTP